MLYLHAGTVKTGTTYIQKVLHENRPVFERYGLAYLPVNADDLTLPRYANARFLYDPALAPEARELIRSSTASKMLVSEEGIFGNVEHLFHPVFENTPKKIILYVRPAAEVLSAWAAELSKPYNVVELPGYPSFHPTGRRILPFGEALDIASHEYSVSLSRFMNIVDEIGRENFVVRPYERTSFLGEDLLTDFLACIGLDGNAIRADPDFRDPGFTNITPSRKLCDVSRAVWHHLGRPSELSLFNAGLVEAVMQMCRSGDDRPVIETLTDDQIEWYTHRFSHFHSFISKTFLDYQPIFSTKYPACYNLERESYRQINVREVELLTDLIRLQASDHATN